MSKDIKEFEGLRVKIDDVIYMPSLDAPPDRPHPFVYFISIFNDSPVPVTVRGRKWVVVEDGGETTVVEGDGVVGQQPVIAAGEHFSYNSYHVVGRAAAGGLGLPPHGAETDLIFHIPPRRPHPHPLGVL